LFASVAGFVLVFATAGRGGAGVDAHRKRVANVKVSYAWRTRNFGKDRDSNTCWLGRRGAR